MLCVGKAQIILEEEAALVYYSPKAEIDVEFTYTEETQEPGIYARYAADMLGAQDVITENKTLFRMRKAQIATVTSTDYNRPHKVVAENGFPMLLQINEKGLLLGYNLPPYEKPAKQSTHPDSRTSKSHSSVSAALAPYPEEVLKSVDELAQANAVAKQIFHLRETRMYLLNGEVEHAPADGRSMELVMEELAAQERALTELFVGKKHVRKEHKRVMVEPSDAGKMLFFSEENGFTDADNVDADTIIVRMLCQQQTVRHANPKAKKSELSQIVYNIPGHCDVSVVYKGRTLASRELPVAQLGADVALPKSWFTGKELPKIVFSEKTGNIVSVSK